MKKFRIKRTNPEHRLAKTLVAQILVISTENYVRKTVSKPKKLFRIKKGTGGAKLKKFKIKRKKKPVSLPPPPSHNLTKKEQKALDKALEHALKYNHPKDLATLVKSGAKFGYANFDGLMLAAAKGYINIFQTMFDENLAQCYLNRAMIEDCIEEIDEAKPKKAAILTRFLTNRMMEVPTVTLY
jgi:hypothetical protein